MLHDDPDAIIRAHLAFFAAGAQVATTASYQASLDGFVRAGMDKSTAEQMIKRSVRLAEQARASYEDDQDRWIAGSVGPYGAALADGSEYRGDYDISINELRQWHRPRIELLVEAGVDVLAFETIPCLAEVEALAGRDRWESTAVLAVDHLLRRSHARRGAGSRGLHSCPRRRGDHRGRDQLHRSGRRVCPGLHGEPSHWQVGGGLSEQR